MSDRTRLFGGSVLGLLAILVVVGVVVACSGGNPSPSTAVVIPEPTAAPTLPPTPTPTPTLTPTPGPFTMQFTSPTSGQVLSQGVSIDCKGTYSGQYPPYVWVVLLDTRGQFYLQNPPVAFNPDGSWDASNVIPGSGIVKIDVVAVDSAGNTTFEQMVNNGEFGAFARLPAGYTILARVSIQVQ